MLGKNNQQLNNYEVKQHYRMYKAKKLWLVAGVAMATLMYTGTMANADTTDVATDATQTAPATTNVKVADLLADQATPTTDANAVTASQVSADSPATADRSMGTPDTTETNNYTFQNLGFNFPNLSEVDQNSNEIDFKVSIYQAGANSGTDWKVRLQLDDALANQVADMWVHPVSRPNQKIHFDRVAGTNIFEAQYIRNGAIKIGRAHV